MKHTFISEKEAADMLGFAAFTLRRKVQASGPYQGKESLPITFTTGGKSYRYSLQDIQKYQLKTSSK